MMVQRRLGLVGIAHTFLRQASHWLQSHSMNLIAMPTLASPSATNSKIYLLERGKPIGSPREA